MGWPCTGRGEGAVKTIDCKVNKVCDAEGNCKAASGKVSFRMEPKAIQSDGSGNYRLHYGDKQADMEALTGIGPFYWSQGKERNTLLISSQNQYLWHQLMMDPAPEASIHYLTCTFIQ